MDEENSTLQTRAQQLLQKRVDAIGDLEAALQQLTAAQSAVTAAEQRMSDALKAATAAGWTQNELRELGLPVAPTGRSRSSKRASRSPARASTPSAGVAQRSTPEPPTAATI